MPAKESVSVAETQQIAGRASHRQEAVGAEIPVTVHASRTTQAVGNVLPPVHEDTKTVIVLPQGAVVRLTASLVTGETVVLTNRMTGIDVLCRVGNVKTQPGIQHYVSLEFTQRAPGFWGDTGAAAAPTIAAPQPTPTAVLPTSLLPSAASPLPVPVAPAPVAAKPTELLTPSEPPQRPVTATAAPVMPAARQESSEPLQVEQLSSLTAAASAPVAQTPRAPVPANVRPTSHVDSIAPSRSELNHSSFAAIRMDEAANNSSGGPKVLLAVAAALLLVLGGAAGGYWFYGQQRAAAATPAASLSTSTSTLAAQPAVTPTIAESPVEPPQAQESEVPVAAANTDVVSKSPELGTSDAAEPRREAESRPSRVPPEPLAAARTAKLAPKHNVPIGRLQAPKAKITSARLDAPPPVISGALTLSGAQDPNSLLAAETAGPAPPPISSRPAVGGRVEPPQAISSVAPAYPAGARALGVHGAVVLDALVDETGKVAETTIVSGPPALLAAAQQAVRTWKYKPAQLNGKPIAVHTKVSVVFNLNN